MSETAILVRLSVDLHRRIKDTAALHDRTMAAEIRVALREHLERA